METPLSLFTSFQDAAQLSPDLVGGKAWNLISMYQAGLPVPPGGVILSDVYLQFLHEHQRILGPKLDSLYADSLSDQELAQRAAHLQEIIVLLPLPEQLLATVMPFLKELQNAGYDSVSVRSSGNLEDTAESSFAGQYDTVLHVRTTEEMEAAILTCWASAFGERVLLYCRERKLDHRKVALSLVVQALVPAEASGVTFTVDPLTGRDSHMTIEAVRGLGEALVQGVVNPDTYRYDWYAGEMVSRVAGDQTKGIFPDPQNGLTSWREIPPVEWVLTEAEIKALSEIALQVQVHYGTPQDIEWARFNKQFYLLQARPITHITFETPYLWTNADFKDGGIASTITTPFMWSLYEHIFGTSMPSFLRSVHIHPPYVPAKWVDWFLGYPYWNLSAVKDGAKFIPGFVERDFDRDLGIEPDYEGPGHKTGINPVSLFRGIRILLAINRSTKNRPEACLQQIAHMQRLIADFEKLDLQTLSDEELWNYAHQMITQEYVQMETAYFFTIYDNSNATTLFHEALEKYNRKAKTPVSKLKLIAGLQDLSHMRPMYDLWQIREAIGQHPEAAAFFQETSLEELVQKYQHNEAYPFSEELKAYLQTHRHHSQRELDILVPHWGEEPVHVFRSLRDLLALKETQDPKEQNSRQFTQFENELVQIRSKSLRKSLTRHRSMLWWREEMRDYSTQMYYMIRIITQELGQRLVHKGFIREGNDLYFLKFPELLEFAAGKQTAYYQDRIAKNQLLYQCYRNFDKPNEIWPRKRRFTRPIEAQDGLYTGIACASGLITAEVAVIEDIYAVNQLKEGQILVTAYTDPAWTPVFSRISGLITETGGMLSHGAVVSREYGVPAVLAVKGITQQLRSGMVVELDGDNGTVRVVES